MVQLCSKCKSRPRAYSHKSYCKPCVAESLRKSRNKRLKCIECHRWPQIKGTSYCRWCKKRLEASPKPKWRAQVCSHCHKRPPTNYHCYCRPCLNATTKVRLKADLTPAQYARRLARQRLNAAIRKGRIIRQPCRRCGSTTRVEAHHPNYSEALNVVWLCDPCHRIQHKVTSA